MDTQLDKTPHPLLVIAGVAVIIFSAVGIAALMGWIPASKSSPTDTPAVAKSDHPSGRPAAKPHAAPARAASTAPIATAAKCSDCGVIESVREVEKAGQASGAGAIGGAVAGGVVGHQVGSGRGRDLATVLGAVGGAVAGNQIEKKAKATKSWEITIRFEDGTTQVLSQPTQPSWRVGDKVKLINGVLQSNA